MYQPLSGHRRFCWSLRKRFAGQPLQFHLFLRIDSAFMVFFRFIHRSFYPAFSLIWWAVGLSIVARLEGFSYLPIHHWSPFVLLTGDSFHLVDSLLRSHVTCVEYVGIKETGQIQIMQYDPILCDLQLFSMHSGLLWRKQARHQMCSNITHAL